MAAISVLAAGCGAVALRSTQARHRESAAKGPGKAAAGGGESEQDQTEGHAHYAAGVIYELEGQPDLALREYSEAALRDLGNETLVLEVSYRLMQANQLEKALDLLVRGAARVGASGAVYARLGYVYSRLGKSEAAIQASREAIKREPRSLAGYQNLFLEYLGKQQDKRALAVLDQAAEVPRADAEFLVGLAGYYSRFGIQFSLQKERANARALELLRRAAQMNIVDPEVRLKLADGFNLLGKDDQAARIYLDLLKQLPDMPFLRESIRGKLADIYLRGHDPKLAVEQLEAVVRDNPTDVRAYYALGSIAYDGRKYAEAAENFNKVLLLDPDVEPAYYDLASAQISGDQDRQALETLDRARQKFPQSFILEYLSGLAYSGQKDYTNAISRFNAAEMFARARDTNHLTREFYFQFGAACERKGDTVRAEEYFEKCLRLSPDYAEALNYLGFMWADRGEKLDRARALIERALKEDPRNAAYLDSMGWVLFKLGRTEEALDYVLKAVHYSEEEDATLFDHLGDIYAVLGRQDKAREAWKKSLSLEPNEQVRKKLELQGK